MKRKFWKLYPSALALGLVLLAPDRATWHQFALRVVMMILLVTDLCSTVLYLNKDEPK
jgi:hypothetical protein